MSNSNAREGTTSRTSIRAADNAVRQEGREWCGADGDDDNLVIFVLLCAELSGLSLIEMKSAFLGYEKFSVLKREELLNYSEFLAATKEKESVELVSGNMPELGMSFLVGLGMGKFGANLDFGSNTSAGE